MKHKTAKEGWRGKLAAALAGINLIGFLAGCQPYNSINLPPPTVRPVQWRYRPTPTVLHITPETSRSVPNVPAAWVPPAAKENRSRWKGIVIHHSADDFGDAAKFHKIHKQKGWDGLGYHFVINNGSNDHGLKNGEVEVGFRWRQQLQGAHCRANPNDSNYWNEHTIGICLVGNFERNRPSEAQWRSLVRLIRFLQQRYRFPSNKIVGHDQVKATKCPGKYFSFTELRRRLAK